METSVNYAFSFISLTPTCFCSSLRFDLPPEKRVKVSVDVRVVHLHAGDAAASENSCKVVGFQKMSDSGIQKSFSTQDRRTCAELFILSSFFFFNQESL